MAGAGLSDRQTSIAEDPEPVGSSAISELCVVDFGEHGRRAIKRLRRGEGRLMDKVEDAILSLREDGILESGGTQTVVIVVREEPSFGRFLSDDDDDDDDDDD